MMKAATTLMEKENRGVLLSPSSKGRKGLQQTTNQQQQQQQQQAMASTTTKIPQAKSSIPIAAAKNSIPLRTVKTKREKEDDERKEKDRAGAAPAAATTIKAKPAPDWSRIHTKEEEKKAEKLAKIKAQHPLTASTAAPAQQYFTAQAQDAESGRGYRRANRGSDGAEDITLQAPPTKQSRPQAWVDMASREEFSSDRSALNSILSNTGIQEPTHMQATYRNTLAPNSFASRAATAATPSAPQMHVTHENELQASNAYIENLRYKQRASMYVRSQSTHNLLSAQSGAASIAVSQQRVPVTALSVDPAQLQWAGPRVPQAQAPAPSLPQSMRPLPSFSQNPNQPQHQQRSLFALDAPTTPPSTDSASIRMDMSAKKLAAIPLPSERARRAVIPAPSATELFGQYQGEDFSAASAAAAMREMPVQANQRRVTLSLTNARAKLFSASSNAPLADTASNVPTAHISTLMVPGAIVPQAPVIHVSQNIATAGPQRPSAVAPQQKYQHKSAAFEDEFFQPGAGSDNFFSEENVANAFNKLDHPNGLGEAIKEDKTKRASIYHGALRIAKKKATNASGGTTPGKDREIMHLAKMTPASGMQRLTLSLAAAEPINAGSSCAVAKQPVIGTPASRVARSALQKNFDRELDVAAQSPSLSAWPSHGFMLANSSHTAIHPPKMAWEDEFEVFEAQPSIDQHQQGRLSGEIARARLEEMRAHELALERELEEELLREEALALALKAKVEALDTGSSTAARNTNLLSRPEQQQQQAKTVAPFKPATTSALVGVAAPAAPTFSSVASRSDMAQAAPRALKFRDCLQHGCGEEGACSDDLHPELATIHLSVFSSTRTGEPRALDNPLADCLDHLDGSVDGSPKSGPVTHKGFVPISAPTFSCGPAAISPCKPASAALSAFKRSNASFQLIR